MSYMLIWFAPGHFIPWPSVNSILENCKKKPLILNIVLDTFLHKNGGKDFPQGQEWCSNWLEGNHIRPSHKVAHKPLP